MAKSMTLVLLVVSIFASWVSAFDAAILGNFSSTLDVNATRSNASLGYNHPEGLTVQVNTNSVKLDQESTQGAIVYTMALYAQRDLRGLLGTKDILYPSLPLVGIHLNVAEGAESNVLIFMWTLHLTHGALREAERLLGVFPTTQTTAFWHGARLGEVTIYPRDTPTTLGLDGSSNASHTPPPASLTTSRKTRNAIDTRQLSNTTASPLPDLPPTAGSATYFKNDDAIDMRIVQDTRRPIEQSKLWFFMGDSLFGLVGEPSFFPYFENTNDLLGLKCSVVNYKWRAPAVDRRRLASKGVQRMASHIISKGGGFALSATAYYNSLYIQGVRFTALPP